ncbi:hypothetical protein BWI96_12570 [Siphonobacter sp. SORGH_AS_0500]|nr:hypothetical protein BWI96_12570 [Siphonobacter sp. SORGH_AS_0500]
MKGVLWLVARKCFFEGNTLTYISSPFVFINEGSDTINTFASEDNFNSKSINKISLIFQLKS